MLGGEQGDGAALLFLDLKLLFERVVGQAHFAHHAQVAQDVALALDAAFHASAGQGLKVLHAVVQP
ncbi:hypothetical protein SDC9_186588 [bioreactor metagenome]|uniref:Uncharacterized protein n=1 Tax=bioreactor metagenome TaxID=1076179 RepID=A0A645HKX7_9ZZZZ